MTAGTAPMMGRIQIPKHSGDYPEFWFVVGRQYSLIKLKTLFKQNEANFIPDWLRAACYEGAYKKLLLEMEYDKARKSGSH